MGISLMRGQLKFLRETGFDVAVASAPGEELTTIARAEGALAIETGLTREIAPLRDLATLVRMWLILRRIRPAIINFGTPKAGLIAGLAARLVCVPFRVYTLRGLRAETTTGLKRHTLLFAERVACACAHRVICVSESLREKALSLGIVKRERTIVLASGSSNGVDAEVFRPSTERRRAALKWREQKGIPKDAPVIGFVGRFVTDKGIEDLFEAYSMLRQRFADLRLLLVGEFEEGDPVPRAVRKQLESDPHVTITGFVNDTAPYYHVIDILALPTYREGFPNVVLEAQAAGKPAVVTNATGAVDSVIDGVTGLIIPVGAIAALAEGLARLLGDPSLAAAMGDNGRKRVVAEFQPARIWSELAGHYQNWLEAKGLPLPVVSLPATESVPK